MGKYLKVQNEARECPLCHKNFTPKNLKRTICYDPACEVERERRWNVTKVDKVKRLRAEGKMNRCVQKGAKGVGRGKRSWGAKRGIKKGITRVCLKCNLEFSVPPDTDYRICSECRIENELLINECEDEALGVGKPVLPAWMEIGNG